MKILLTGASGFLGNAYAAAAIRRGHEVTGLANLTLNLHPIASKLKTQPINFNEQLEALTYTEPLQA
jgi:nucleoside-diphosphate-sugar epimerase